MKATLVDSVATPKDDADLRRLLRESPMEGAISLSFEREPSYFAAAVVEGPICRVATIREKDTGELVSMGSRTIRPMYLNGSVQNIGYLNQLRSRSDYRSGWPALRVFSRLRKDHRDGLVRLYLASVIEGNTVARRFLERGLSGRPQYHPYVRVHSYGILTARRKPDLILPDGFSLVRGDEPWTDKIIVCLQRNGARRQFAPYWSKENLFTSDQTPDLRPEDFFLMVRDDAVVGCMAGWDQSAFKQTVVRGYSGAFARWRWAINIIGRLMSWPILPPVNTRLAYCFASHLAVDKDQPEAFAALLRALYNHVVEKGYSYLLIGLCENDPFRQIITAHYKYFDLPSQIYLVTFEEDREVLDEIDDRPPYLEIAIL